MTRINLSDQTDISDLFGSDLPEEGGMAGRFIWRDGPFLTALKEGQWILLDEVSLLFFTVTFLKLAFLWLLNMKQQFVKIEYYFKKLVTDFAPQVQNRILI